MATSLHHIFPSVDGLIRIFNLNKLIIASVFYWEVFFLLISTKASGVLITCGRHFWHFVANTKQIIVPKCRMPWLKSGVLVF